MCGDCDVPLVTRLDSDLAAVDPLVPLTLDRRFDLVSELLDRLEKENVPYVIEAGTALRRLDDDTAVINEPEEWEARVSVLQSRQRRATEILADVTHQRQLERTMGAAQRKKDEM